LEKNIPLATRTATSTMVPWLREGIRGVLPLEHKPADGMELRPEFPNLAMVGHLTRW
jgi:hypothetical protein